MARKLIDKTGYKYGKLLTLRRADNKNGATMWVCLCDCVKESIIRSSVIGKTKSCRKCFFESLKGIENLVGRKFGHLTVSDELPIKNKNGQYSWKCLCDCGRATSTRHFRLLNEKTSSCKPCRTVMHGKTIYREYLLFSGAKSRAKKYGMEFNIKLEDVVIPEFCPALGILLDKRSRYNSLSDEERAKGIRYRVNDSCPSLDRIDSNKDYVKGNVWVISARANRLKNNSMPEELRKIADAVELKLKEINNG